MKNRFSRRILGTCLILCIAAAVFGQGMYWESTMSGGPAGERVSQMYAMPKMFKTVTQKDQEAIIVRLDKELIISIDGKEKTYSEMTFTELEGMVKNVGSQMTEKMAAMKKELAAMPEEQRKMIEQMMGDKMGGGGKDATLEVKSAGEKKSVSGHACSKYVINKDGKEFMTIWATKDVKEFDSMRKDWEEFSKRMMLMNPMWGKGMAEAMRKVEGFPMETDMSQGFKVLVTKIEKRNTSAGEFEIPTGYKKVKSNMMMDKNEEKEE